MFAALKKLFVRKAAAVGVAKRVLNVGGGGKSIGLPPHFCDWEQLLLDIDPRGGADLVCDARKLRESKVVSAEAFDAVYCSHNLEHYYRHDVDKVLRGFLHVLKPAGFAEIRVPDIGELIKMLATRDLDLEQEIYKSSTLPITAHDMIFGYGPEIEASGQDFYAHKTGFSADSLVRALRSNGFGEIYFAPRLGELELHVFAFKTGADAGLRAALALGEPVATHARHTTPALRAAHDAASNSEADPVEALYQRAAAAWRIDDVALAATLCDQAIALAPDLPALHYLRGCCLMEQAQHESALQSFGRCLELRPKEPLLAEIRARQALCRERIDLARSQGSRG
ncbi:MAG: methyltransferase domain-containing protein [Pseudomonadota bacterium]